MAKVGEARGRTVESGRDAGPVEVRASPRDPGVTCPPRLLRGVGSAWFEAWGVSWRQKSLVTCVGLGSLRGEAWAREYGTCTTPVWELRNYSYKGGFGGFAPHAARSTATALTLRETG